MLRGAAQHARNDIAAFVRRNWVFHAAMCGISSSPSLFLSLFEIDYILNRNSLGFPEREEGTEETTWVTRRRAFDNTIYGRGRWRINFYGDQVAAAFDIAVHGPASAGDAT